MSRRRKKKNKYKRKIEDFLVHIIIVSIILVVIWFINENNKTYSSYDIDNIPDYNGNAYVVINANKPDFDEDDYTTKSYE